MICCEKCQFRETCKYTEFAYECTACKPNVFENDFLEDFNNDFYNEY